MSILFENSCTDHQKMKSERGVRSPFCQDTKSVTRQRKARTTTAGGGAAFDLDDVGSQPKLLGAALGDGDDTDELAGATALNEDLGVPEDAADRDAPEAGFGFAVGERTDAAAGRSGLPAPFLTGDRGGGSFTASAPPSTWLICTMGVPFIALMIVVGEKGTPATARACASRVGQDK